MRKLTKASLSELAESKEIISFLEQKSYVGGDGGTGTSADPYMLDEVVCISYDRQRVRNPNNIRMTGDTVYELMYESGYAVGFKAGVTKGNADDFGAIAYAGFSSMIAGRDETEYHPEMIHQSIGILDGLRDGRKAVGK